MLSGKVALITGASAGIGAETAIEFAKQGAFLVLTGRNVPNLLATASKCFDISKNEAVIVPGDLTKDDNVKSIINTCIKSFNKIDILVNNAGIVDYGGITEAGVEQLDKMYHNNLRPAYLLTQLAVPHLMLTRGNVVNVSSVAGIRSFPLLLTYCINKAGLDHFTRTIAVELAKYKVRVNSVNPGLVDTAIHITAGMAKDKFDTLAENCRETHPLQRIGRVDEVAKTILFLASENSSFITGETICVDGGKHALCPL